MSGIAGFVNMSYDFTQREPEWSAVAEHMARATERGERLQTFVAQRAALCCAVQKEEPECLVELSWGGNRYAAVFDGTLSNGDSLRALLKGRGHAFCTQLEAETALVTYLQFGEDCVQRLAGVYAFAVWDSARSRCFLCRDPMGGKRLYYTRQGESLLFSTTPKGLMAFPGVSPRIEREGWCSLLTGMAPPPGKSVFSGVEALPPGGAVTWQAGRERAFRYFSFDMEPHDSGFEKTARTARELLFNAVTAQMAPPERLSAWLDRDSDAGAAAAVAAGNLTQRLFTYSLEPPPGEPSSAARQGTPWPALVSGVLHTNHRTLLWEDAQAIQALYQQARAGLLPGAAPGVFPALLQAGKQNRQKEPVLLAGVCGSGLFGLRPWLLNGGTSLENWLQRLARRGPYFKKEWLTGLEAEAYIRYQWEESLAAAPRCPGENEPVKQARQAEYLTAVQSLSEALEQADALSPSYGGDIRLPLADAQLVQYLIRIPKEIKCAGGRKGALLQEVLSGLLPGSLFPREQPEPAFPAAYGLLARRELASLLEDKTQPLHAVVQADSLQSLTERALNPGIVKTTTYFLQLNQWMQKFQGAW